MESRWDNLGLLLSVDFLPFFFVCLGATYLISLMFMLAEMFTILKGLEILSSPTVPVKSYLLLGRLMCFGVTVRSYVLNSY